MFYGGAEHREKPKLARAKSPATDLAIRVKDELECPFESRVEVVPDGLGGLAVRSIRLEHHVWVRGTAPAISTRVYICIRHKAR